MLASYLIDVDSSGFDAMTINMLPCSHHLITGLDRPHGSIPLIPDDAVVNGTAYKPRWRRRKEKLKRMSHRWESEASEVAAFVHNSSRAGLRNESFLAVKSCLLQSLLDALPF